jgi:hypothetical protein
MISQFLRKPGQGHNSCIIIKMTTREFMFPGQAVANSGKKHRWARCAVLLKTRHKNLIPTNVYVAPNENQIDSYQLFHFHEADSDLPVDPRVIVSYP